MDINALTPYDRNRFMAMMEEKQVKDSLRLYHNLVERCFLDCANDFTTKTLTAKEEACVNKCCDKFLKYSARIGQRFAEQNTAMVDIQQQLISENASQ
ncbi:hypothetical protein H696_03879 [Fonticula alba]|uniref:Mitochondrial import inner membrane translocase subunit n=1 Tax=Fonticula alba TaxID=691883 RepID=A0A058Z5C2_FONAL|nr:hypothetical protein H696_03879 [Fonticula alba]KCV69450.1 hypothetical protein H696_03879 [Fonticula alba]|eukprot:XP_009496015.1 hypothetical protein H696_03879 [Fonticula alba]